MREVHPPAIVVEMARQPFRDKDRPVLAARAANRDGEIFFSILLAFFLEVSIILGLLSFILSVFEINKSLLI